GGRGALQIPRHPLWMLSHNLDPEQRRPSEDERSGRLTPAWLLVGAATLTFALSVFLPWRPFMFTDNLDSSWGMALHAAFAARMAFGEDVVFALGPLGFLYVRGYFPATSGFLMALQTYLIVVVWCAAFTIARRVFPQPARSLVWLITFLTVVASGFTPDPFFFTLACLLLVGHFYRHASFGFPQTGALIVAFAIASLVKFTFFVAVLATVGVVPLYDLLRLRRVPLILPAYVAAVLAVWIGAGQSPLALGHYLSRSFDLATGYPEAMSLAGPQDEVAWAAGTALLLSTCVGLAE